MKKFVLIHYGYTEPTKEIRGAWNNWFKSVGDQWVDIGSPLGKGVEISSSEVKDLAQDTPPITGYSIVSAPDMASAVEIAKSCPSISGIRVYEAMAM